MTSQLVRSANHRRTMKTLAKGTARLVTSPLNDKVHIEIVGEKHTYWLELSPEDARRIQLRETLDHV